jgi:hypothetical protein
MVSSFNTFVGSGAAMPQKKYYYYTRIAKEKTKNAIA